MTAAGLFFAIYGRQYDMGTSARMGPGYFPIILGWALAVIGLMIAIPAWWRKGTALVIQWSNLFWCVLSLLSFAATLYSLGVVVASFVASLLALVPSKMPLLTRMIVCAVVALLTTLIFPIALQMMLPVWPWSH